jgi:hypothetical protein
MSTTAYFIKDLNNLPVGSLPLSAFNQIISLAANVGQNVITPGESDQYIVQIISSVAGVCLGLTTLPTLPSSGTDMLQPYTTVLPANFPFLILSNAGDDFYFICADAALISVSYYGKAL